jgi:hypothetical protein
VGHPSDHRFLVLHGLRLKGFGEPPAIGAAVGLDAGTVEERLPELAEEELVVRRDGRLAGWSLTREGRSRQQQLAAEELVETGTAWGVRAAYVRFLDVNGDLLAVCTDWQVRGGTLNDHSDARYDGEVIDRLRAVASTVQPIVADLTDLLDRYGPYGPRFSGALERVAAGDQDYITKPIIDSFHTIWFELHEDLLTSLGIERSQEGARS